MRRAHRKPPTRRRRRIRKLRLALVALLLAILASAAFAFGVVTALAGELDALDPSRRPAEVDTVVTSAPDAAGRTSIIAMLRGDESRVVIGSEAIAGVMKQAIVAIEDRRFYEHRGIDLRGMARALWEDARRQRVVQGGSTITQQYVKLTYLRSERTVARKVREAAIAWQLEQRWSKDRILAAYLNTIYFGNGAYGVQQAARTYFQTDAARLTLPQAALLAGIPVSPTAYDPVRNPAAAAGRRSLVLALLEQDGRITHRERLAADAAPLPRAARVHLPDPQGVAPHFVEYVKAELVAEFGSERVFGGGLEVTTTLDLELQEHANAAIETVLPGPDGPTAALVAIDPRDGSVKAMVGGTSFDESQFNLATQSARQPGSSFKPIVLTAALRAGIAPQTQFVSRPVKIQTETKVWEVENYKKLYNGRIDLIRAMVVSDNTVYAQLTALVGPDRVARTAKALGIRGKLPAYFSIGLGAVAVNPLDLARAYATIANDGVRVGGTLTGDEPRVLETVRLRSGRTHTNEPTETRAIPAVHARIVTEILRRVVEQGTGRRARISGRQIAGKTGTADDYADAWFVGWTPALVVVVWVGYPDARRPMTTEFHGKPVSGGTLPALVWRAFMERALEGTTPVALPAAPRLGHERRRIVDHDGWKLDNGLCPGSVPVAFLPGRAPTATADCAQVDVRVPRVVGAEIETARALLEAAALRPDVVTVARADRTPGTVIVQRPRGGMAPAGSSVTLRVAVTPPPPRLVAPG